MSIKRIRITNDTPSSKSTLRFASPNLISDDAPFDSINNRREREISVQNSPLQLLFNIQQNSIPLDITDVSSIKDHETDALQTKVEKIDEEVIPATYPTNSRQEDEKNERLREFREKYSLQQTNNSNVNKRKRSENHNNVIIRVLYTVIPKYWLLMEKCILQEELSKSPRIHPIDRHSFPVEDDKLKQITLCK